MASSDILKKELIKRGSEIEISMCEKERMKIGRKVLARCVVICFVTAIISSLAILGLPAQQTEGTVTVTVNAPEYVEETFNVIIDVANLTNFNAGQFDLSFNASVVNVTAFADGSVDGDTIPVDSWEFMDKDRIRVILDVSGIAGVNGSGNLATISFAVVGEVGDKSMLNISNGLLVNTDAEAILAEWFGDEVIVGPTSVNVEVNAPEYVEETFDASIDVDNIVDFNSGQFDLSFNASVVNVTGVADGSLDGETVPVDRWEFVDKDRIRVILDVPGISGVSGSGYVAKISFAVVGETGDKSVLDMSNGLLVDTEAEAIPAEWIDDEVTVGTMPVQVTVNAPEYVEGTFDASIDVDSVAIFNSGQFDLAFDSSVVNVTDIVDGSLDGETIPVSDWERLDNDTIRVILDVSGIAGVNGSGNLATISFVVVGETGDKSVLDMSNGLLVDTEAEEIPAEWIDAEITVGVEEEPAFDTGPGTYPSIFGTHEGTIEVYDDITVEKLYTYPCAGTGGHSESVKIWNATGWSTEAAWSGYTGDCHNIVFSDSFTLHAGGTYNYTIKTCSYPQIHHTDELEVAGGTIRCTKFTDANGKIYDDWIPAIKLW